MSQHDEASTPVLERAQNMSLRDLFAAHAMQGMLSRTDECNGGNDSLDELAVIAYKAADAMLAAR